MRSLLSSFVVLLCACVVCYSHPMPKAQQKTSCGYESCPSVVDDKLNVHLVAHTHDDVGWLKTVDQYYYGSKPDIQRAGVQYIIDSVVNELTKDPSKRFIYVETAFLWKWWQDQGEAERARFRELIDSGRLEMTGGAWSMNDEAATHYQSTVDQFTLGFRMLNEMLGPCAAPRVGWQIDPFGHSREMASLLAQMGMDGLFFGRLDEEDKQKRIKDTAMEMVWQASPDNLGPSSDLFTHALYNFYFSPPGFCFDIMCNDLPMIDNPESPDYNIPHRVEEFMDFVREQAAAYKTNNILVTMGGDFHYQAANAWFDNLDKLIKYTNEQHSSEVNVFYSTPSCYLKAVNEVDQTWPVKQDDFFPYGSESHAYWTGYFTSKPTVKYFERLGNNFLQVSKQLTALTEADTQGVAALRETMGILQHHDAITGTMKDHVAHDYSRILAEGIERAGEDAGVALSKLMSKESETPVVVTSCLLLNISECEATEGSDSFVVTVYNPLSRPVSKYVRFPVTSKASPVRVTDPQGNDLATQVVELPSWVTSLPGRDSEATNELVFLAADLPPVGYRSYFVTVEDSHEWCDEGRETLTKASKIGNEEVTVNVDADGSLRSVTMNGVETLLRQTIGYYKGFSGARGRASGAYIFRPDGSDIVPLNITKAWVFTGDLVQEVHQQFEDGWVGQVIRVYKGENHVEFEWQVGPIPEGDHVGKEIVSRFESELGSGGAFSTDSNGREMLVRMRDSRPTWNLTLTEPVASNFYPVTSKIAIAEEVYGHRLAVLVDRAQAGSSLKDGHVELMVHRRLFEDDGYGVDEALNEQAFGTGLVARGRHFLSAGVASTAFTATPSLEARERWLAQEKLLPPWLFFTAAAEATADQWRADYNMEFSGLTKALPENVQLLTLESWSENSVLVRLEHILEKTEDPTLSSTAEVNLQDMFSGFTVTSAAEMTLGANHLLEDKHRMTWRSEGVGVREDPAPSPTPVDVTAVQLEPMQIRTFVVGIAPK